jgi:hypothetical protein
MQFVHHPLLNIVLNRLFDSLQPRLENNLRELLCETAWVFCKAALATGRSKRWPGSDHRIALLNACYSSVFPPLKADFNNVGTLSLVCGNEFGVEQVAIVFDIKKRVSLIFKTPVRQLHRDRTYYEDLLRQPHNPALYVLTEWRNMWHIYLKEPPEMRNSKFLSYITNRIPKCYEICEIPDVEGFSIIYPHKLQAKDQFPAFDLYLMFDCVPQDNDELETIRSLHAVLAQRYPGATLYADQKTARAPIYMALGYGEVASRNCHVGWNYRAFIHTFPK